MGHYLEVRLPMKNVENQKKSILNKQTDRKHKIETNDKHLAFPHSNV